MISLCNGWEFTAQWTEAFAAGEGIGEPVRLPHTVTELPLHYADHKAYQMLCGYRKRLELAPELEEFTICQMQALINLGMPNQAIKHYEDYCVQLWKNYSLQPSNTVEQVHSLALHALYDSQDTIEKIVSDLGTLKEQDYSFQCSLPVFRNIVQLELRQLVRSQQPSSLAVMKIVSAEDTPPTSTDIRRLERVLLDSLRTGDPFTRLNQGAFILLLPGASEENSHKVMARVKNNFYSAYPRSTVTLQHKIFPLSVDQEEGNLILAGELE